MARSGDGSAQGGDHHELEHLHNRLRGDINDRYEELAACSIRMITLRATDRVRRLMFLEKLLYEIDDALASLEE
jgi:molecular chaperone HscB